jgi:predicted exporter
MNRVRLVPVLVFTLALCAVSSVFVLRADASASPVDPAEAAIEQAMGQMNDALKVLSKGVNADNREAALAELTKFETAIIAAKSQVPASAEKVDEKKRPAFVAEFRKSLIDALKIACDAEAAVTDGKYKEADKLIANKLGAMKSAGHSKFKDE